MSLVHLSVIDDFLLVAVLSLIAHEGLRLITVSIETAVQLLTLTVSLIFGHMSARNSY